MALGKNPAERLAFKLRTRCVSELPKTKSWEMGIGDTYLFIGETVPGDEKGFYEFRIQEREVGRFGERTNWEVFVVVNPHLDVSFSEVERRSPFVAPPPWKEITRLLSCASRGPDR